MEKVYQLSEQELLEIKNLVGSMGEIYDNMAEKLYSDEMSQEALLELVESINDRYGRIHSELKGIFGENSSSYFR